MCVIAISEQLICRKWNHIIKIFPVDRLSKINHRSHNTGIPTFSSSLEPYSKLVCGNPRFLQTPTIFRYYRNLSSSSLRFITTMSELTPNVEDTNKSPTGKEFYKISKRQKKRFLVRQEKRKAIEEGRAPKKKKTKRKDDFYAHEETLNETSYYFENGLRKVYPYYFKFSTFAKGRWFKRTLLDVFCHEFKHFPDHIFKQKIADGQVLVNGGPISLDYVLKDNDFISHLSHRHEVPVTAEDIGIIHDSDELLVVNKPSSLPCHPCGSFRHNSLIYILWKEQGYKGLKFVHRIDRLTSGLLIFAKNETKAAEISHQVAARLVQKEYVCRVEGEFPSGVIECKEPLDILSFKLGLQKVSPSGKDSWTSFERMSYNGHTSVVRCRPHTGRTHQIRVHLQYLGYPIINDPLYNTYIWGPQKGKNGEFGKSDEEVIAAMLRDHDKLKYVDADLDSIDSTSTSKGEQHSNDKDGSSSPIEQAGEPIAGSSNSNIPSSADSCTDQSAKVTGNDSLSEVPPKVTYDPTCLDCKRQFKDPSPQELVIYLHALKYKGPDWEFESPLPAWAAEDWEEPSTNEDWVEPSTN